MERAVAKSVRVHDDTHRALMELKTKRRGSSLDHVIREMIRETTGTRVEDARQDSKSDKLTKYVRD
jgi:hypothetical protein